MSERASRYDLSPRDLQDLRALEKGPRWEGVVRQGKIPDELRHLMRLGLIAIRDGYFSITAEGLCALNQSKRKTQ